MNSCEVNYLHISTAGDHFSEKSQHKIHGRDFQCLKKHRKVWLYIYTFPQNVQILIRFTLNDFPSTSWAQIRVNLSPGRQSLNWPGPRRGKDLSISQTPWTYYSGFTCCSLKRRTQIRSEFFSTWLTLFWLLVARVGLPTHCSRSLQSDSQLLKRFPMETYRWANLMS